MDPIQEHLNKLREERHANEKARIQKLRDLNIMKYNKNGPNVRNIISNMSADNKSMKDLNVTKNKDESKILNNELIKSKDFPKKIMSRPSTAPNIKNPSLTNSQRQTNVRVMKNITAKIDTGLHVKKNDSVIPNKIKNIPVMASKLPRSNIKQKITEPQIQRKPLISKDTSQKLQKPSESVFERLYKPKKTETKNSVSKELKPQTNNLKINRNITNKNIRRSISAVHFKRIGKDELPNCIHKWASIGDKINATLKEVDEDAKMDKIVTTVKSDVKKVKFLTPIRKYNTPRPEELQIRLKSWLIKHGKCIDSYENLQSFGINYMVDRNKIFELSMNDENKENIALDSDSDNESYAEIINEEKPIKDFNNWRKVSVVESFSESPNTTAKTIDTQENLNDLLYGAFSDLTDLIKEGYDWEQCAIWLGSIRERFPTAVDTVSYWECYAALEERRGGLSASVQCWEEAIVRGAERSVVDANLDQLLDKFMQLNISPKGTKRQQIDPKLVDVKNVFKSTIIRFAVQQAKLRQANQDVAKYTVTPVRRSNRLSTQIKRTPFRDCPTIKQLQDTLGGNIHFVPNEKLYATP